MELVVAATFRERLLGLAFAPASGRCLLLPGCRSVHTIGMRFALDLFWLDADWDLVRVDHDVPPGRFRGCRRASAVVELPSRPSPRGGAA